MKSLLPSPVTAIVLLALFLFRNALDKINAVRITANPIMMLLRFLFMVIDIVKSKNCNLKLDFVNEKTISYYDLSG
jgi:hypothetical protein